MARCGCTDDEQNRDVMRGGCGLAITGRGTNASPRTIDLVADDCVCAVVEDCVTDRVCGGLSYAGGCLGVKVSRDGGNRLRIAGDGGVYGDCTASTAAVCAADVSQIPAFVVAGYHGAGLNVAEQSVRPSFVQATSLGLDLTTCRTSRLADGSFYTGPDNALSDTRYSNSATAAGALTGTMPEITTNQAVSLRTTQDVSYGACDQPQCGLDSLTSVLRETRHRVPLSVELPTGAATTSTTTDTELLDLLNRSCAQGRVIVHVAGTATDAERAKLATFRTAGYETGVQIDTAAQAAVHTAAKLQTEGVKWAYIHKVVPDATITPYVTGGRQVLLTRVVLRTETARAQALGLRGILSDDPVYAGGAPCSMFADPWCLPAVPSGQIAIRSAQNDAYRAGARGEKVTGGCGWVMPVGTTPAMSEAVLLGWASYIQAAPPTTYTLTWEMRVTEVASRRDAELGLIICAPDDSVPLDASKATPAHTLAAGLTSGYVLRAMVGNTTTPGPITITKITKGAAPGPSSTATPTTRFVNGTWVKFTATVTPESITFTQYNGATPGWTTTLADTSHRGGYMWANKWDRYDTTPLKLGWSYRNFVRT